MITYINERQYDFQIEFVGEQDCRIEQLGEGLKKIFKGKYLQQLVFENDKKEISVYIGIGNKALTKNQILEVTAFAADIMKGFQICNYDIDVSTLITMSDLEILELVAHGICLGNFEKYKATKECMNSFHVNLTGIVSENFEQVETYIHRGTVIGEGVIFARELVNCPSNCLKPMDMAKRIVDLFSTIQSEQIEMKLFTFDELKTMGMEALCSVGESSVHPPCLLVIRYTGNPIDDERLGLVGKGVTVDTGGYCLKPSSSMAGIKGDMAGAAATASALYALAKNGIKKNATVVIPMCENRISNGSLLPGDVISSYSKKTIEVMNTDAEGRLILADAISYAVKEEKVSAVLDIATLTGSVVNMLGFSIAGVLSDSSEFYDRFVKAYEKSGEQYHRLPYGPEHEKMIDSEVADVKNIGESYCGTITAGLFIRRFAEGVKWIHVDIAGTAWVDTPIWKYQKKGATGAGVSTLYYLCQGEV